MSGNQVVFVSRHGVDHSVPPHKVNYRANIWAMKSLGTEEIFATTAVGSLNPEMKAGHFVVCDNVLDFTKSRINTFYDSPWQTRRSSQRLLLLHIPATVRLLTLHWCRLCPWSL
jgi:purine nucleoside phosphorylase